MERFAACLEGSLSDLSIQDILLLLFLDRKTGHLALDTQAGTGAIVFRLGRVIASMHDGDGGPPPAPEDTSVSPAEREALIRERITAFVLSLARSRQGQFSLVASRDLPQVIQSRDVQREALHPGIDPIDLLIAICCAMSKAGCEDVHTDPAGDLSA